MTSVVGPRRSPSLARSTEADTARETSGPRKSNTARSDFQPARANNAQSALTKLGATFVPVTSAEAQGAKSTAGTQATPLTQSISPNADIKDNTTVTSTLEMAQDAKVSSLKLDLDIEHTYRGDLMVKLTAPSGKSVMVSDRQGSSADDLKGSFDLSAFAGESTKGTWTLEVQDKAKGDSGTLKQWGLNIVPETKAPEPEPEPSDDPFNGLRDEALLKAVRDSNAGIKVVSYNDARKHIFTSLDVKDNGKVECVYTGLETPGGKIPNNSVMNVEHTWPQSKGATGPAKSDLHHLFPTDSKANSKRSSFPFGEVVNVKWSHNGAKLGTDAKGNTVFEPPDSHKGNVARAMFYFSSQYSRPIPNDEEAALKKWNKLDAVDAAEIERNRKVATIQGNTNKFVEHSNLADRIKDF
ncbi:endonuclease [Myxococcus landrumensis]|uniref:Endonuclease n=1 Tax=Myxococcus landrumensis TaxID=2813577 RepID=A0ABX7NB55_9BACT|nr:endonuclease [Myxococcus landrumus]QSQ16017.1 endonuclease [Myxococcus landrumus]